MTGKIMPLRERDISTVQAAADAFLSSPRHANPNTRRGYTGVLDRLLAGLGASRPLAEVSGEELAAARDQYAALLPVRVRVLGPEHRNTLADRARLLPVTRHEHLVPPTVSTAMACPFARRDTIVSARLGEAVAIAPRSAGHRHCR
jgi:hypothetical protein